MAHSKAKKRSKKSKKISVKNRPRGKAGGTPPAGRRGAVGGKKTINQPQLIRQLADQGGENINSFDKLRVNAEPSRSIKIMATKDMLEKAKKELADLTGFKSPSAVGFKKEGEDLIATIEVIEKESIPDGMDVLGTYEVRVEASGKIISYERTDLRKRVDTALNREV